MSVHIRRVTLEYTALVLADCLRASCCRQANCRGWVNGHGERPLAVHSCAVHPALMTGLICVSGVTTRVFSGFPFVPKVSMHAVHRVGRCVKQRRRFARLRTTCSTCCLWEWPHEAHPHLSGECTSLCSIVRDISKWND